MAPHRQHAHLEAPVDVVWDLVGTPSRHPEWWPRVIQVQGERFEEGDEYAQVTKTLAGRASSNFVLERLENLREVRMSCTLSGMYADWLLTPAQGGTFVEVEMGMQPKRIADRAFYRTAGKGYFRRWASESLDALRRAAARERDEARC
jgi:polyketide cyclase/dehydrase/lipid transport protein